MSTETEAAFDEAVERIKRAWDSMPDVNQLDVALDPELMLTNAATVALRALLSDSVRRP